MKNKSPWMQGLLHAETTIQIHGLSTAILASISYISEGWAEEWLDGYNDGIHHYKSIFAQETNHDAV